jgi:hypothetical protein
MLTIIQLQLTQEEKQEALVNKLEAIKIYKRRTGEGLLESKAAVECWLNTQPTTIVSGYSLDFWKEHACTVPGCPNYAEPGFVYCEAHLHGTPRKLPDEVQKALKLGPYQDKSKPLDEGPTR